LIFNDGMKLEMRAVPRYKEAEAYIEQRMAASPAGKASPKTGFGDNAAA
jgi:hypothetical protein